MRRACRREAFRAWFDAFLPDLAAGEPREPVHARLRLRPLATARSPISTASTSAAPGAGAASPTRSSPSWRRLPGDTADAHLDASLPHVAGDYMGEHWLATFALLALEGELVNTLSRLGRTIAGSARRLRQRARRGGAGEPRSCYLPGHRGISADRQGARPPAPAPSASPGGGGRQGLAHCTVTLRRAAFAWTWGTGPRRRVNVGMVYKSLPVNPRNSAQIRHWPASCSSSRMIKAHRPTVRHQEPLGGAGGDLRARPRRRSTAACAIWKSIPASAAGCCSPPAPARCSWPARGCSN